MTAGLIVGLAAYGAFLCWRVQVERGWVGISEYRRVILSYTGRLVLLGNAIAAELTPALRKTTKAFRDLHVAFNSEPLL